MAASTIHPRRDWMTMGFEEELDVLTTRILVPLRGDKTLDSASLEALRELDE